jgi:hypothetical protein
MVTGSEGGAVIHPSVQFLFYGKLQIDDRPAAFANKMVVGTCIGIEAIKGAAKIYLFDQALLSKNIQVPIHSAHAQIGELIFQPGEDPIGRGVPPRALEQFENPFPLFASLELAFFFDDSILIKQ